MKIVKNIDELIEVLEANPDAEVKAGLPQFNRHFARKKEFTPKSGEELKFLIEKVSRDFLYDIGVVVMVSFGMAPIFGTPIFLKEGAALYLFPTWWYYYIPDGFPVVHVSGRDEKFIKGESQDYCGFNCLPYGFIRDF